MQGAARAELARMCRHTLVAMERGHLSSRSAEEALQIAFATVRDHHGAESVQEDEFREILAEEEKRVADAMVLAELISARLSASSPAPAGMPPAAAFPTPPSPPEPGVGKPQAEPLPPPTFSPATPGHLPDIADMIDGMIAQDRSAPRRRNP